MSARIRGLAIATACLLFATRAASQPPSILDSYQRASWSEFDGVSLNDVTAITQDGSGYLWLGTGAGLVRFDGVRFTRWETIGPALPESSVTALRTARDGSLWIGFGNSGGVARISDGQVRTYNWRDGMLQGRVDSLLEDHQGTVWVGGIFGLARLRDQRWERLGSSKGLADGQRALDLFEDAGGSLWVVTSAGLLRRSHADVFEPDSRLPLRFRAMAEDSHGAIWVSDPKNAFRPLQQAGVSASLPREWPRAAATNLLRDRRGYLWVATGGGLLYVRDQNWSMRPSVVWPASREGVSDSIQALYEDREGNIWIGTSGGLSRISVMTSRPILAHPEFRNRNVRVVTVDKDGAAWVGTSNGLIRFAGNKSTWYRREDGLPGGSISALHVSREGTLWAATDRGVARLVDRRFVPLPGTENVLNRIVAMTTDADGGLWLCDFTGLYLWKDGALTALQPRMGRPGASSALADSQGRVWVGFVSGGLSVHQHGATVSYTSADGLPDAIVSAIYEDRRGVIWVATTRGLARFTDGRFTTLAGDIAVTAIAEDDEGYFWLGTRLGLVRTHPAELERIAANPSYRMDYRFLDIFDGFENLIWVGAPTSARAPDGSLWFVSRNGISTVDPHQLQELPAPSPVRIERVTVDDQPAPTPHARVSSSTRRLQVDFTSLSFSAPSKLRFRYMLEGFDPDWTAEGTRRQAFYTNLSPGRYRFRVAARNVGGPWTQPTDWDFLVPTPFYQTRAFYVALITILAALTWMAWRRREVLIRRKYATVLAERARIGREIHDTLLQGMVAVALQLEGALATLDAGSAAAKQSIARARDSLEYYVRETRSSIWELRSPLLETRGLPSALRVMGDTLVEGSGATFGLEIRGEPFKSSGDIEQNLLRIAQEGVSNAVRHAHATHIQVDLEYQTDSILMRVSDDGRGVDGQAEARTASAKWGLRIMRERAEQMRAQFHMTSSSTAGTGTRIETIVPRPQHARG